LPGSLTFCRFFITIVLLRLGLNLRGDYKENAVTWRCIFRLYIFFNLLLEGLCGKDCVAWGFAAGGVKRKKHGKRRLWKLLGPEGRKEGKGGFVKIRFPDGR